MYCTVNYSILWQAKSSTFAHLFLDSITVTTPLLRLFVAAIHRPQRRRRCSNRNAQVRYWL